MNGEVMRPTNELWFDGPNYTADAIVISEDEQKILLIERSDGGGWALPGGFINDGESSHAAAIREAKEEATANLTHGQLVYRGIVDDPRNNERAWIETDAYLFTLARTTDIQPDDDAKDAAWFKLTELPELYASHHAIIERALDVRRSIQKIANIPADAPLMVVEGGLMNYSKNIVIGSDAAIFIKSYDGPEVDRLHLAALQKEAAIVAHLRTANYPHIPAFSHHTGQNFFMEALPTEQGWRWRAPKERIDQYIQDCLNAFAALELMPIPPDTTDIPSSLTVYRDEGWQSLDHKKLAEFVKRIEPQLYPDSRHTAKILLDNLAQLRLTASTLPAPETYVFCHHDARQANIAWHPDHGVRLVDWSWADIGRAGSDATMLLIDLHKHGHDITSYKDAVCTEHAMTLMGFWLDHALRPVGERDQTIRLQQFVSALAAYEVLGA